MYKYKNIYVVCPDGNPTGGHELLHQLVFAVNELGGNARIVCSDRTGKNSEVPSQYRRYTTSYLSYSDVEDSGDNLLVVPETQPDWALNFKYINVFVWWMSVDNFRIKYDFSFQREHLGMLRSCARAIKHPFSRAQRVIEHAELNLYQSEYAKSYLMTELGVQKNRVARLGDYLGDEYLAKHDITSVYRENRILYNPKKGIEYTRRLIEKYPNYQWIPLEHYSAEELVGLMQHSKIYIDLGNHPGKDRLPREAAALGCCVITNRKGAAAFKSDYPIPDQCRLMPDSNDFYDAGPIIEEIFTNFESWQNDYSAYRDMISKESELFTEDVKSLFFT